MKMCRFYYHDLEINDSKIDIVNLFEKVIDETKNRKPQYAELTDSKLHIQIIKKEVITSHYN